ncbi:MAG TPA: hypothetical protein VFX05_13475 [Casimicrobiaceae bacterium]|nr:hypothetical protein [Casimicrobiaceae bacterium]
MEILVSLRRAALAVLAGIAALTAMPAQAQQCANFGDVTDDGPNGFCPSVEWMKNRNVTTGCGGGNYCPQSPVSRLAMAAFMKRLGDALTPIQLAVDASPGALDIDVSPVVCQTTDFAVTGFPRTAYADVAFSGLAPSAVSYAADLVFSTNAGAAWTTFNTNASRGSSPAGNWGAISDIGARNLDVGQTVRFGVRASRGGVAGGTDLTDSRCQLRVLVYSRTGAASPY